MKLFRYSGSKVRLLQYLRPPPKATRRVVEGYLGSGAYSLNSGLPALGIDNDDFVVDLWHWLQSTTPEELRDFQQRLGLLRRDNPRADVRTLGLSRGEMLYAKINVCSVMVGQWSSWGIYPQHELPVAQTLLALEAAGRVEVRKGTAEDYEEQEGDLLFLDPPYLGTHGNYTTEGGYDPASTMRLVSRVTVPTIFTYGETAPEAFPDLPWEKLDVRMVPNLRRGGLIRRLEYVAYMNWPEDEVPVSIFDLIG